MSSLLGDLVPLSRRQVDNGTRRGAVRLQSLMKRLAERREQELRLVGLRRAPVLDPVARRRERAVDPFDGRNGCGTGRERKSDSRDIQPFDHDLRPAVRSSARSSSAATITAPEMASASRMAGTYSASIMGRVPSVRWVRDWRRAGLGQRRAGVN